MEKFSEKFSEWMKNNSDPRVENWFLMSTPVPSVAVCVSYLLLAKFLHVWMKNRRPIEIRWPIWCFDFFHLVTSSSLIFVTFHLKLLKDFNFRCQMLDKSTTGDTVVNLAWWFFIYNFTFFSEIYIFLLGKRHERITNYFLYHHIALPISIWFIVKFCPTGHSSFFAITNCSVHMISFGYLSLIGAFPKLKKHFWWWKKFFHTLLILRIVIIVLHAFQLFLWNDCNYPMIYPYIVLINAPFFFVLTVSDHLMHDNKRKIVQHSLLNLPSK